MAGDVLRIVEKVSLIFFKIGVTRNSICMRFPSGSQPANGKRVAPPRGRKAGQSLWRVFRGVRASEAPKQERHDPEAASAQGPPMDMEADVQQVARRVSRSRRHGD